MIGRTPGNIVAVRPLRDGVISDYDITERMLKEFIKKACEKERIVATRVMVCVPSQATEVEKRAVMDFGRNSGAKKVQIIEESLATTIGAGLDITKPNGTMIVDICGGVLLDGLNKLIEENIGVLVEIGNNSVEAVAEGSGQVLNLLIK